MTSATTNVSVSGNRRMNGLRLLRLFRCKTRPVTAMREECLCGYYFRLTFCRVHVRRKRPSRKPFRRLLARAPQQSGTSHLGPNERSTRRENPFSNEADRNGRQDASFSSSSLSLLQCIARVPYSGPRYFCSEADSDRVCAHPYLALRRIRRKSLQLGIAPSLNKPGTRAQSGLGLESYPAPSGQTHHLGIALSHPAGLRCQQ